MNCTCRSCAATATTIYLGVAMCDACFFEAHNQFSRSDYGRLADLDAALTEKRREARQAWERLAASFKRDQR